MGKYKPLNVYLKMQNVDVVPMTFAQIEAVLGSKLPASKTHRAWWSNNPDNNVMTREWLEAGFETEAVDIADGKLVFRRAHSMEVEVSNSGFGEAPQAALDAASGTPKHPGFGFMKGLITFADGFDPTEPSLPDWEEYAEQKYGKGSKLYE